MTINRNKAISLLLLLLIIAMVVVKAYQAGTDINVYLYASGQLGQHENIYAENPYNDYLYSPLFALLLWPLSVLDQHMARIIWALINVGLAYRLWALMNRIVSTGTASDKRTRTWWTIGLIVISIGALLHNLNLGQITVVILWLTLEGLYQIILKKKNWSGAVLLALGINIKIIPMIALYYLFFKRKFRPLLITIGFVIFSLWLPAVFVGHQYNLELLENWKNKINPAGEKYLFETSNGCSSLGAILPAYFYYFGDAQDNDRHGFRRKLVYLSDQAMFILVQAARILLILSVLPILWYSWKRKREDEPLTWYWEMAYLMSVTILLFPHQMKYALLLFAPAGSYMFLYVLGVIKQRRQQSSGEKGFAILVTVLLFIFAISGRDLLGRTALEVVDYYHIQGLTVLVFLFFLYRAKPEKLMSLLGATAS